MIEFTETDIEKIGSPLSLDGWKHIPMEMREEFNKQTAISLRKRIKEGVKTYGLEFHGQPLPHLKEELLDALFYQWVSELEKEYILQHPEELIKCKLARLLHESQTVLNYLQNEKNSNIYTRILSTRYVIHYNGLMCYEVVIAHLEYNITNDFKLLETEINKLPEWSDVICVQEGLYYGAKREKDKSSSK